MDFKYRALNKDNVIVSATVSADNQRSAMRILKKDGLNVTQLEPIAAQTATRRGGKRKASARDTAILFQQLCVLLQSGVGLNEAIDSLAESFTDSLGDQCGAIGAALRRGESFSAALAASKLGVPAYFYSLAEAGEMTGRLGQALQDGLRQWEYELETRKKLVNSLTYPAILVFTGCISVALIFTLVVPKFVKILEKSRAEIPLLARIVLESGKFVNDNLLLIGAALAFLGFISAFLLSNTKIRQAGWDFLGCLPLLKEWIREADIARWSAMLATLLENRVDLLHSLDLAHRNVSLTSLQANFAHIGKAVRGGTGLAQALREGKTISATGHNLIRVGEKAGELPAMLRSLARLSDDGVKTRMQRFLLLVEPAAIIIIGGVVGTIMAGIMLAITSMSEMTF